jgi:hypothetical protein
MLTNGQVESMVCDVDVILVDGPALENYYQAVREDPMKSDALSKGRVDAEALIARMFVPDPNPT